MKALYKYVMAILLFTIVFVTNSYGQFKLVGDASSAGFNNAGSNRYSATIVFRPDLTGNYYDGTDVLSGYKLFTSSEQMYTILSVSSTTYNTASVTVQADTVLNANSSTFYGIPSGQVLIYDTSESEGALQVPFGSVGASARMQAAVDSWNIKVISNLLSKTVNVEPSFLTNIIRFNINTDSVGTEEGHVIWNTEDHTLDIHSQNGTVLQVNQEMVIPVKNKSGVTIEDGMPVRFAGTEGASGRLLVQAAVADGSYPVYYNLGTTTNTIPNDSTGLVTVFGKVRGIDLDGISYLNCNDEEWEDGTLLYLDPVTEGCYTSIIPSAPNHKVLYAAIVAAKNNGTMMVRPGLFPNIRDLNGVSIVDEAEGDVLLYKNNVWTNDIYILEPLSGSGPPVIAPRANGDTYFDFLNNKWYKAWDNELNNGSGDGLDIDDWIILN